MMAAKIEVYLPCFGEDHETDLTDINLALLDAINNRYGALAQHPASVYRQGGNDEFLKVELTTDDLSVADRNWWENRRQDWIAAAGSHRSFRVQATPDLIII
jgi:hypothetical protein